MLKEFHMRVIHKAEEGQFKALVRGRNQYGEFVVDFYVDGVVNPAATYYTDDKADAVGTADAWVSSKVASDQFWAGAVGASVGAVVVGAGDAGAGVGAAA